MHAHWSSAGHRQRHGRPVAGGDGDTLGSVHRVQTEPSSPDLVRRMPRCRAPGMQAHGRHHWWHEPYRQHSRDGRGDPEALELRALVDGTRRRDAQKLEHERARVPRYRVAEVVACAQSGTAVRAAAAVLCRLVGLGHGYTPRAVGATHCPLDRTSDGRAYRTGRNKSSTGGRSELLRVLLRTTPPAARRRGARACARVNGQGANGRGRGG